MVSLHPPAPMLHRIQTPSGVEITDRAQTVVVTVSDIDEEHTPKFAADVARAHATGQTFLPVVVDSYGGDTYALMAMWSILDAAALPIVTVVTSKAMSCGLGLFAAGQVRIASPRATLLLHDVSTSDSGDRKSGEAKADAHETERLQSMIFARLDSAAGKKPGYFEKLLDDAKHADVFMSAQDAKKQGLVTHVGTPSLTTAISITATFTVDGRAIRTVQ